MATVKKSSDKRAGTRGPKERQDDRKGVASVTAAAPQLHVVEPDPEVRERAARRRFPAEYKLRIVREADACTGPGELGALLRREGLYSSHLTTWRRQRDAGALSALSPKTRGRRAAAGSPLARRVAELEREKARLERRLKHAETIMEVQKQFPRSWGSP